MLGRTLRTFGKYLIVAVVIIAGVNLLAYNWWQARERGRLNLLSKRDTYLAAPEDYGVVFFGDSRTFCAFHPDLLEGHLGTPSYNLSFWANWLPTQYAYIDDVAPHIAPGTVFVWSLGHVNFAAGKIRPVYPVGWPRLRKMLETGFDFADLRENLFAYTPVLWWFGYRDRSHPARDLPPTGDLTGLPQCARDIVVTDEYGEEGSRGYRNPRPKS